MLNLRLLCIALIIVASGCSSDRTAPEEQISASSSAMGTSEQPDLSDTLNSVNNKSLVRMDPQRIILTGMPQHRLVTLYKTKAPAVVKSRYESSSHYADAYDQSEHYQHFMPGIDLVYGYNLLNVMHYDLAAEKLNGLFDRPVLIKSLYYPSFIQDSIEKKPINRDYYLVTAYDVDTNADTLLNRKDLRHMYYFNADGTQRIQLIPTDHSVERSQYDWKNDIMYIFARHDTNKNGQADKKKEPLHVFWFDLKKPAIAKRMY